MKKARVGRGSPKKKRARKRRRPHDATHHTHRLSLHRYRDRRKPNSQSNSHTPNVKPHGLTSLGCVKQIKRAHVDLVPGDSVFILALRTHAARKAQRIKSSNESCGLSFLTTPLANS